MSGNKAEVTNEELAKYDFVVMIDKSGSMGTEDCPGGKSRWAFAQEQTEAIAREAAKFDENGIDLVLFSTGVKAYDGVGVAEVTNAFATNSPGSSTDTAGALQSVFDKYNARNANGEAKPLIIICVTDGAPDDQNAVDKAIVEQTKKMTDDGQLGIQFVQIGNDSGARAFLKHLDDELVAKGAKYDIVDTKDMAEMADMGVRAILTSAITD